MPIHTAQKRDICGASSQAASSDRRRRRPAGDSRARGVAGGPLKGGLGGGVAEEGRGAGELDRYPKKPDPMEQPEGYGPAALEGEGEGRTGTAALAVEHRPLGRV